MYISLHSNLKGITMYYQRIKTQMLALVMSTSVALATTVATDHGNKTTGKFSGTKASSLLNDLYQTVMEGVQMGAVTKKEVADVVATTDFETSNEMLATYHFSEIAEPELNWQAPALFLNVSAIQTLEAALVDAPIEETPLAEVYDATFVKVDFDPSQLETFVENHPEVFATPLTTTAQQEPEILDLMRAKFKSQVVMSLNLPSLSIQIEDGSTAIDQMAGNSEIKQVSVLMLRKADNEAALKRAFTKEMLSLQFGQIIKEDRVMVFGRKEAKVHDKVFVYIDLKDEVMLLKVTGAIKIEQQ